MTEAVLRVRQGSRGEGRTRWHDETRVARGAVPVPQCKAWGASGKKHNLIMGQAGFVKGGPLKRCGRFTVPAGAGKAGKGKRE